MIERLIIEEKKYRALATAMYAKAEQYTKKADELWNKANDLSRDIVVGGDEIEIQDN